MSSCLILVNDDGSVNLSIGSADIGQGCETTFSQIVAEELGIDLEAVAVTAADTLHVPYDTGTFASGQIYVGGNAVHQAAQDIKERIRAALADHYRVDSGQVRCEKGRFTIIPMKKESEMFSLLSRGHCQDQLRPKRRDHHWPVKLQGRGKPSSFCRLLGQGCRGQGGKNSRGPAYHRSSGCRNRHQSGNRKRDRSRAGSAWDWGLR